MGDLKRILAAREQRFNAYRNHFADILIAEVGEEFCPSSELAGRRTIESEGSNADSSRETKKPKIKKKSIKKVDSSSSSLEVSEEDSSSSSRKKLFSVDDWHVCWTRLVSQRSAWTAEWRRNVSSWENLVERVDDAFLSAVGLTWQSYDRYRNLAGSIPNPMELEENGESGVFVDESKVEMNGLWW